MRKLFPGWASTGDALVEARERVAGAWVTTRAALNGSDAGAAREAWRAYTVAAQRYLTLERQQREGAGADV